MIPNLKQAIAAIFLLCGSMGISMAQKAPRISVDQQVFNFGSIEEAKGLASHVFTITNQGDKPLVITQVTASCGCTRPEWTKEPIAAGKSGMLKVTYDPNDRPGPFYKTITIYSNAENRYNVAIKGNVIPKELAPEFTYPYAIGNLKLHTKNVLFNSLRQNESFGEKISIKNEGETSLEVEFGKMPGFIIADMNPASLKPNETGEITFLADGRKIKQKGRHLIHVPLTVKSVGEKKITETVVVAINVIDDFSKLSDREKAKGPALHISGTLLDFGELPSKKNKLPFFSNKVTGTVDISNTGKSNLIIYSFTSDSELISISRGKKEIKPGETTTYKVSIRPKDVKVRLETLVNVISNDPNGPVRLLEVTAHK